VADKISDDFMSEAVIDKGYHSKRTLLDLEEMRVRSYASEPDRGRQHWGGQEEARDAVYANRRRVKGDRGKRLLRSRGEKLERTFAHCYETGAMRRLYLRGRDNIAKRVLIHAAAFNVGLMMRLKYGLRKPRSLAKAAGAACALLFALVQWLGSIVALVRSIAAVPSSRRPVPQRNPSLAAA
jgi:transposase